MKYLVGFSRIFVGVLFIISGFIKLNDPVGFSFKLEEYFSQGVLDLPSLAPHALSIALLTVVLEVLLGVFLIVGYKPKFTVWSLLGMIVFFTFLTFYSAYFNKVTDCGCFGDAIKLTPWESFTKDVVLLALILLLVYGQKQLTPWFSNKMNVVIVMISLALCVGYANHVLRHLPVIDFRPYKIGANIPDGMTVPEDAPKPIFEYAWTFEKDGKKEVITTYGDYPQVAATFIGVETNEIQKGYEPPIHDFTIEQDGIDHAPALLQLPKLVFVVAYDLRKSNTAAFTMVSKFAAKAKNKGYKVIGLSASGDTYSKKIKDQYQLDFDFYFSDETALKTIVRSNPAILVLEQGTIIEKVHYNDIELIQLK